MPEQLIQRDLDTLIYFTRRITEEWPELMDSLGVPEGRMEEAAVALNKMEGTAAELAVGAIGV